MNENLIKFKSLVQQLEQEFKYKYNYLFCDLETIPFDYFGLMDIETQQISNETNWNLMKVQSIQTLETFKDSSWSSSIIFNNAYLKKTNSYFDYYDSSTNPIKNWIQKYLIESTKRKQVCFFHNGSNFDFSYFAAQFNKKKMFHFLVANNIEINWTKSNLYDTFTLTQTKLEQNKDGLVEVKKWIKFVDTTFFIQGSIASHAKKYGITKQATLETLHEWNLKNIVNDDALFYCFVDVVVLAMMVRDNQQIWFDKHTPTTTSSQARKFMLDSTKVKSWIGLFNGDKELLKDSQEAVEIQKILDEINEDFLNDDLENESTSFSKGFRGGLCTHNLAYNYHLNQEHLKNQLIFILDVKSQYPHKMTWDMPKIGWIKKTFDEDDLKEIPKSQQFVFYKLENVRIKKEYENRIPPYLNKYLTDLKNNQEFKNGYTHFAKVLYFKGLNYELDYIKKFYQYEQIHFVCAYYWTRTTTILKDYILEIYKLKAEQDYWKNIIEEYEEDIEKMRDIKRHTKDEYELAKLNYDPNKRSLAKLLLNAGYGSFCMRLTAKKWVWKTDLSDCNDNNLSKLGFHFNEEEDFVESESRNMLWAAIITSNSRAYLMEEALRCINNSFVVLYHDTDSVFFTRFTMEELSKEDEKLLAMGHELGDWEIDKIIDEFYIFGNKKYYGLKNGEACKFGSAGISSKNFKNINNFKLILENGEFKEIQSKWTRGGVVLYEQPKTLQTKEIINFYQNIEKIEEQENEQRK